jgi:hypothetical protein
MKIFKLLFLLILLNSFSLIAQKKEDQIIKQLKFETDKIILNKELAFHYSIDDKNHFIISNLENKEIITGDMIFLEEEKWSSVFTFVQENKVFSNSKIIGRNQLFFKLLENNVITKDFKIDPEKLTEFLEKYNESK